MAKLVATAEVLDQACPALAVLLAAWLLVDLARWKLGSRRAEAAPSELPLSRRAQLGALVVILAVAAACRLLFLSYAFEPAYWDSAINTLMIDEMLKGVGF